jgi:hypothetical protein
MPFRFSMKWLLATMVYAAIAAAAFSQDSWVYPDLLWVISVAVFGYVILLVWFTREARQAAAAGFVVLWACIAVSLYLAPDGVPTLRMLHAFGMGGAAPILPTPVIFPQPAPSAASLNLPQYAGPTATIAAAPAPVQPPSTYQVWSPVTGLAQATPLFNPLLAHRHRAANAVATIAAGLLGGLLGYAAYKRGRGPTTPATPEA